MVEYTQKGKREPLMEIKLIPFSQKQIFEKTCEILVPAYLHSEWLRISCLINIVHSAWAHDYFREGKHLQTEYIYVYTHISI